MKHMSYIIKFGQYLKNLELGQVKIHFMIRTILLVSYILIATLMLLLNMNKYIFVCLCFVYLGPETIALDGKLINNDEENYLDDKGRLDLDKAPNEFTQAENLIVR